MTRDIERIERIVAALQEARFDALICTLPENVLLLSGYWPVVGTAVAVVTSGGQSAVLAPEDELDLAQHGWADDVRAYAPGALETLILPAAAVCAPLAALLNDLGVAGGRLGFEDMSSYEPSSYAALYLYQASIQTVLTAAAPRALLASATSPIVQLRSSLTTNEVERVRAACSTAQDAFLATVDGIRPGRRESEVAAALAAPLQIEGLAQPGVQLAGAFTWCMSGPNSALAGAAYARTRNRELRPGDLVLVHCNSYMDGYWTDITRTYVLGPPDERQTAMYRAISAARTAALAVIRPGARAADVDAAARQVLHASGFGKYFTHGIGHNVGFSAISGEFPPRLHPASPDILATGMTFNIEPSIYIHGYGAIRHCDVVTVRDDGPEVLTPFQIGMEQLTLPV